MYWWYLKFKKNETNKDKLKKAGNIFLTSYIGSFLYLFLSVYLSYPLEYLKGNYIIATPTEWLILIGLCIITALIVPITIDIIRIQNWKPDL